MQLESWKEELTSRKWPFYYRVIKGQSLKAVILNYNFYDDCWEVIFLNNIIKEKVLRTFISSQEAALFADIYFANNSFILESPMIFPY